MKPTHLLKGLSAIALFLFVACQQGDVAKETVNTEITYSAGTDLEARLKNYTNADWLFEHYLGDYGVPEVYRQRMDRELKMVANGFALQYAKGEDVEASINYAEQQFAMSKLLGGFSDYVNVLKGQDAGSIEKIRASVQSNPQILDGEESEFGPPSEEEKDDEELLLLRRKEDSIGQLRIDFMEGLVEQYDLPYKLPKSKKEKVIVISPKLGMKGGSNKLADSKDPYAGLNISRAVTVPEKPHIERWAWRTADMVYVPKYNNSSFDFVDHIGLVKPIVGTIYITDAHPDNPGVIETRDIDTWQSRYTKIKGYRYIPERTISGANKVYNYAKDKETIPYSVNTGRTTKEAYYCSKLVWQSFFYGINVNIDDNMTIWGLIYPSDIVDHSDVRLKFSTEK